MNDYLFPRFFNFQIPLNGDLVAVHTSRLRYSQPKLNLPQYSHQFYYHKRIPTPDGPIPHNMAQTALVRQP